MPGAAAGGCEIAQRMSMVITHWPVLRSHCRIVLSEAPVTYGVEVSMRMLYPVNINTYQALILEVHRGNRLGMAL